MVDEVMLARDVGDGQSEQIDDKYDGEEYSDKDDRAPTRTTFYARDIEELQVSERRKDRLRSMLRRQEGEMPGEAYATKYDNREQQNRSEWKRRMVTTFTSQLDMTDAQQERVLHLIQDVLSINSFGHYSTEQVIIGTINVVAREDGRFIEDEPKFRKMVGSVGVQTDDGEPDLNTLSSLRGLVRDRLA